VLYKEKFVYCVNFQLSSELGEREGGYLVTTTRLSRTSVAVSFSASNDYSTKTKTFKAKTRERLIPAINGETKTFKTDFNPKIHITDIRLVP